MSDDNGHVVVEDGLCTRCAVPTKQMHHRDFPEIRAECGSVAEGTAHLASQLSLYREGAQSAWHRELIDSAIADVAEFLDALDAIERDAKTACGCGARVAGPTGPSPDERCSSDLPESTKPRVPTSL